MPTQAELQALKDRLMTELPEGSFAWFNPKIDENIPLEGLNILGYLGLTKGGVIMPACIDQDSKHMYLFLDKLDDFPRNLIVKSPLTSAGVPRARGDLVVTWSKNPGEKKTRSVGSMLSKVGAPADTFVGCFRFNSCDEAFLFIQFLVIKSLIPPTYAEVSASAAAVVPK